MVDGTSDGDAPAPVASFGGRRADARSRLAGSRKPPGGAPAYLRFVNRPIGGWCAAIADAAGVSPDHLTVLGAAVSAAGIAVLALCRPTVVIGAVVALLLLAGYALDSADGRLARLQGGGTPAGEWLDHVVDVAKLLALHAAVLITMARWFDLHGRAWLLVPVGYELVGVTLFFGMVLRDQLAGPPAPAADADRSSSTRRSILLLPVDFGALALAFCVLGVHGAFLGVYATLGGLTAVIGSRSLVRAHRALRSVDRPPEDHLRD